MAIPVFAVSAHGGKIVSLDDTSVVKDLAALAGTGGTAFAPFLRSTEINPGDVGGYATLRRLVQRVQHDGAVTVKARAWRDGQDTGQEITRPLALGANPTVVAPFKATGSAFQLELELSAFDAPASLGAGQYTIVSRRGQR